MGWIFWDKLIGGDFSDGELAFTSFERALKKFTKSVERNRATNAKSAMKWKRIHPCQKPIALYKWLLQNYAKQGDIIFDSHLGSGSSRIAAYDLGFDFYACELDKDYFNAQEERFQRHIAQPTLFEVMKVEEKQDSLFE
jgi:site-specific DNA-methyltransferase (adenine-specific)